MKREKTRKTVKQLFVAYKNMEDYIPKEVLELECNTNMYDKKHIVIKDFFKKYIK